MSTAPTKVSPLDIQRNQLQLTVRSEQGTQSPRIITLENSEFLISVSKDRLMRAFSVLENEPRAVFHLQQAYQLTDRTRGNILYDGEAMDMQYLRLSANLGSRSSASVRIMYIYTESNTDF